MQVSGDVEIGRLPVTKTNYLAPLKPYDVSKMTAENCFLIYRSQFDNLLIFKLDNTYGPGQDFSNFNQGMVSIFNGMAICRKNI